VKAGAWTTAVARRAGQWCSLCAACAWLYHLGDAWAGFGHTQAAGVQGLQQHSVARVGTSIKQTGDLLPKEQLGLLLGHLGHGWAQVAHLGGPTQHGLEQEPASAGDMVDAAVRQFAVFDQMQQIGLNLLGRESGRIDTALVAAQAGYRFGVARDGAHRQAAHGHGVDHAD